VTCPSQVEKLLDFIAVLIRDPDGAPEPEVDEDFEEQQHMVGSLTAIQKMSLLLDARVHHVFSRCISIVAPWRGRLEGQYTDGVTSNSPVVPPFLHHHIAESAPNRCECTSMQQQPSSPAYIRGA
jgi:hypothetical protein